MAQGRWYGASGERRECGGGVGQVSAQPVLSRGDRLGFLRPAMLKQAGETTHLPDVPTARDEMNDLLLSIRSDGV